MLSLTSIVDVRVNAARAADTGTGFSTGLILAPASGTSVTEEQRLRTYVSAADMLADVSGDFTASSPAYLAAKSYFEANPAPDRVYVSLYPSNRNPADGLDAVLDRANDFYGIYVTETNAAKMTDEEFREYLRQRIALHHWDGTNGSLKEVLDLGFPGAGAFITDNMDGTVTGNVEFPCVAGVKEVLE